MFNEGRFRERVESGELTAVVKAQRMPSQFHPERIPPGSVSQEVRYYDADNYEVARVHQYVKPDGTLGGSGLPDPKRLYIDGIMYRLQTGGGSG
jgi:hypothetical protein